MRISARRSEVCSSYLASVRRGADRTNVLVAGIRQADRRCRVQPRLCGCARRRALHGDGLHRAEPAGRHCLFPGEPEAARMTAAAADETATAVRAETEESPARRAFRRLLKRRSAVIGLVVVLLFIAVAVLADVVSPRSDEHTSELQSLMP